jgi:glycosyltransferase involved in cell wall biosynthesis
MRPNAIGRTAQRLTLTGYSRAQISEARDQPQDNHRVSVVVPCHNYGRFLRDCVESVLVQRTVDVDVLIVNDASTDDSAATAEALAAGDERVRVHHNPVNLGHIASYNVGFSLVTGEFVMLLSADDLLVPGALARAVALLEAHPSVGFAYGWSVPFHQAPLPPARTRTRSWSIWSGTGWVADRCRRGCNVIRSSDAVVRRSVLDQVGGYREDLPHSGDFEWWMRAALAADVGMVCGADQIYYRLHGRNMSRTAYAGALVNLREAQRAFDAALAGGGEARVAMRQLAHRTLARQAVEFAIAEQLAGNPEGLAARYAEFAATVDPAVAGAREWRTWSRLQAMDLRRARRSPVLRGRAVARDLERKIIGRRWHFSGI